MMMMDVTLFNKKQKIKTFCDGTLLVVRLMVIRTKKGYLMKKKVMWGVIAAGAVLTIAVAGTAVMAKGGNEKGEGGHGEHRMNMKQIKEINFAAVDINSDGNLTLEEFEEWHLSRLKAADTNGDGALDEAEMMALHADGKKKGAEKKAKRMMHLKDEDGDGKVEITQMSLSPSFQKAFMMMDADGDSFISAEELEAVKAKKKGGWKSWFKKGSEKQGEH